MKILLPLTFSTSKSEAKYERIVLGGRACSHDMMNGCNNYYMFGIGTNLVNSGICYRIEMNSIDLSKQYISNFRNHSQNISGDGGFSIFAAKSGCPLQGLAEYECLLMRMGKIWVPPPPYIFLIWAHPPPLEDWQNLDGSSSKEWQNVPPPPSHDTPPTQYFLLSMI